MEFTNYFTEKQQRLISYGFYCLKTLIEFNANVCVVKTFVSLSKSFIFLNDIMYHTSQKEKKMMTTMMMMMTTKT